MKKEFEKMTIVEIENEIREKNRLSLEMRGKAVLLLLQLRNSGRYKENPLYRKSSFENYLLGVFNIRYTTFLESARAYEKYPKESAKYGVGLVAKVHRACGVLKECKVIEEINAADKAAKTPLKRDKIEAIIQKYAKPTPPAKPGYKTLYVAEAKAHERTKEMYKVSQADLKQAREQIEKLKATILDLKSYFVDDVPLEEMTADAVS